MRQIADLIDANDSSINYGKINDLIYYSLNRCFVESLPYDITCLIFDHLLKMHGIFMISIETVLFIRPKIMAFCGKENYVNVLNGLKLSDPKLYIRQAKNFYKYMKLHNHYFYDVQSHFFHNSNNSKQSLLITLNGSEDIEETNIQSDTEKLGMFLTYVDEPCHLYKKISKLSVLTAFFDVDCRLLSKICIHGAKLVKDCKSSISTQTLDVHKKAISPYKHFDTTYIEVQNKNRPIWYINNTFESETSMSEYDVRMYCGSL